jgi:hypothetical protein
MLQRFHSFKPDAVILFSDILTRQYHNNFTLPTPSVAFFLSVFLSLLFCCCAALPLRFKWDGVVLFSNIFDAAAGHLNSIHERATGQHHQEQGAGAAATVAAAAAAPAAAAPQPTPQWCEHGAFHSQHCSPHAGCTVSMVQLPFLHDEVCTASRAVLMVQLR